MEQNDRQNMKRVTLVGCGNIGFRHLQAIAAMARPSDITIVEPAEAARPRIEALIAEANGAARPQGHHVFRLLPALSDLAAGDTDLAIFATDTRHRRPAWDELRGRIRPAATLFEKVLFPTIGDIDAVAADLDGAQIAGFVNCGRRGFPDYQALAQRFGGKGIPVDVTITGARFGLGSNTVHFLDLAEMLNGAALVSLSTEGLEPGAQAAKRPGYVEIFGTIRGELSNGAKVSITCADSDPVFIQVDLAGQDGSRIAIDELAGTATESGATVPFSIRHVSQMTELYEALLQDRTSALTPYADSARQHRLYLQALRAHLGLSNAADEPVPVS